MRNHQLPQITEESEARQTMLKAYDFAVGHVGLDVASGPIWAEYLEFTQSNYYKLVKLLFICVNMDFYCNVGYCIV